MRYFSERPYLISLLLIAVVTLWMLVPHATNDAELDSDTVQKKPLQKVQIRSTSAQSTDLELVFTGRTEPDKQAQIASELDGLLLSFKAERGSMVKKGDSIAEIDTGSLSAALAGAKAEESSAATEYKAQVNLVKRGLNAQNGKAAAFATLQAARARVQQIETELKKASVIAPFDGLIADHLAEAGDFMSVGKPLAVLIDLNPIRAVGDVAERDVRDLSVGAKANVVLLDGKHVDGEITYISPFADKNTRTFRVEVSLPNDDGKLVAGMTAQVKVHLSAVSAYKISPALLTLNAKGDLQVAAVDADNKVVLHKVDLIRSDTDGIWVDGIPDEARLITLGQGFVNRGDLVEPIEEKTSQSATKKASQ